MKTKLKGFLEFQGVLLAILLGFVALSFLQISSGQFAALAASRKALQAQQFAQSEADYLRNVSYDQLSSAAHGKKAISGANGWMSAVSIGSETTVNNVKQRIGTIQVYRNNTVASPDFSLQVPLSSAGSGGQYYVVNNNYSTGKTSVTLSGGYFHGYYNGTEYPFYFDGYKKMETYTKAQVEALINSKLSGYYTKAQVDSIINTNGTIIDVLNISNFVQPNDVRIIPGNHVGRGYFGPAGYGIIAFTCKGKTYTLGIHDEGAGS